MRTKKALSLLMSLMLVLGLLSGAAGALAEDAAQTGVTYYINGLEDLLELADKCAVDTYSKDVTVILQTDIDLTGSEFSSIPTFGGVFEGGGHTISGLNLTANRSHTGFFRYIQPGAEIKELNLAGSVTPGGSAEYAGGLAGNNAGTIRDCSFNGTVEALTSTGGLVGANEETGVIENCRVSGTVTGQHYTGGIAGQNLGSIVRCVNSAAVNTTSQEISTDLSGLSITSLDSTTELINDYTDTGGIAGFSSGTLSACMNTGAVGYEHMGYNIGGIVGRQSGFVENCTNSGGVLGRKEVGGIVGQMEPYLSLDLSAASAENLSTELSKLHDLLDVALLNAGDSSTNITNRLNSVSGYMGSASDDLAYIAGETVDFVDNTVASLNDILSRIDYVSDSAPYILGDVETAGSHISDAMGWLAEVNRDLSVITHMQGSSYDETNHRLLSVTTGTGGYARADTSNPAAGSLVSVELRPDTGYEVGRIEVADADGASVAYDYDPALRTVTFIMPVLSGDPVNDPVNARAKSTVVRVAFVPTETYFYETGSQVSIATNAGGTVTATQGSGGIYVLDINPNNGYELASLSVTDENGAAVPFERIDNLGTQYAFTLPASGRACVNASFQRVSDWDIVSGAADTIGSAGSALGSAMDNALADADALMAELNRLLQNPNPSQAEAQALLDALGRLSSDLTSAGGAAADIIGAGNTIAGAMGPYIAEAAVNLNEHLGYAMQSLQAASNSITDAVAGVRDVLSYLNGLPDVQFQGLGSEYSQRVDSLCGNMKNISDALTALNTELGSSATVLVDDLRKVNDQFSVVMLMLVDAIKTAANPNIGDVFTDVSEEEGSATEGNVAGCGNSGSVYGDVNVGGVAGAMAIEFDFDPESDLTGSTSISRAFNSRCILRGSENNGTVRAKDNCAGGVVGLMELGVTQGCQNYGAVSSESGDYVGGIAGSSNSTIRACWAMCPLTGDDWVGGIAGLGMKLYDCRSLVEIDGGDECLGGVAGALSEDGEATGNLFVSETLHGIDGISYTGGAERVPFASLKALEDVPSEFLDLKLVFVADGVTIKTIHFEYGDSIPESEVPAVPAKEGCTGAWPELDLTNVTFSRTLEAVYTPLDTSVASTAVRGDGVQSLVLVEGSFQPGAAVEADVLSSGEAPEDAPALSRGTKSLEELSVSVTGSADEGSGYRVRYLAPEPDRATSTIALYVREGGAWQEKDYDTLGNYLCFDVDSSDFELLAVERPADMTRVIIIGAAAVVLVLIITIGSIVRHKRAVRPAAKHSK
ncbi:MAG: GLUG motif-containing protein [Candidatus Scatomorpha sp.]|jgi:hypothetical protein